MIYFGDHGPSVLLATLRPWSYGCCAVCARTWQRSLGVGFFTWYTKI